MEQANEDELAKRLGANLREEERLQWQTGDAVAWTNESLMLVRTYAYAKHAVGDLSDDYVEGARDIVRRRLLQAGIRLAWLLNTAFK